MESSPWQTLSSKPIYENPWISIIEDQVINPAGKPGIYGKVSMKNIAIGIIPIDDAGNTWLVGQHRYVLNEYSWEIPMGGGPKGIDPLESAKRELLEETGITAANWQLLMKLHTSNSVCDEVGLVYVARELSYQQAEPEETEQLQIKKLPLRDAIEMALTDQITDSISVAGLLKVSLQE